MDHREHSVYFDDYNSWDTWHLVPSSRPTPSIPEPRTNFVTIPGRNGSLDLSEALTGGMIYEDRELDMEFIVLDQGMYWMDIYQDVVSKIHGKRMKIRLVDDPEYYYMGRVTVGEFTSNSDYSSISVNCQLETFKYKDQSDNILEAWINLRDLTFVYDDSSSAYIWINLGKGSSNYLDVQEHTTNNSDGLNDYPPISKNIGVTYDTKVMLSYEGMSDIISGMTCSLQYGSITHSGLIDNIWYDFFSFPAKGQNIVPIIFTLTMPNASDWQNLDPSDAIGIFIDWGPERSL